MDAERRAEAAAQLAFAIHAAHHPRLAAIRRRVDRDIRQALTAWLEATGHGENAAALADAVVALADGLALRMLYAPHEHASLLAALDRALDPCCRVTGPPIEGLASTGCGQGPQRNAA
ncbi:TetR family transcriptional regulator C-terminal domain-containing protein [Streptomyces pharetrae]|uniref:TetR family transcriptional regulator C-terminal domain-containing protein n=1 Tax=Streptomyces pharetrae TaxID=291370 RepID=UPI0036698852